MIETVLLDFPSTFEIGILMSLIAMPLIRRGDTGLWSTAVQAGTYMGLAYGVGVGYWCYAYPDWMWTYAADVGHWNFLVWYPPFVAGLTVAGGAGAACAQAFISSGRYPMAVAVAVFTLWWHAAIWVMTWDQYSHLATYAQWQQKGVEGATFFQDDKNWNLGATLMTVFMLAVAGFLIWRIVKATKAAKATPAEA